MSLRVSNRLPGVLSQPTVRAEPHAPALPASGAPGGEEWRAGMRTAVLGSVAEFVSARRATDLEGAGLDTVGDILAQFLSNGKCLRSTFMYLGWLCGAPPSGAALTAAASLELLHAFALIQDDVMDRSAQRRGRPAAHVQLAQWHREREPASCAEKFGESAAVLLGDICLIWAEQMLRESGIQARRLQRVWPRYDAMRTELAIGQFADLAADLRSFPTLDAVLDVARRKSGNYTVRRPLELGAAMAGCGDRTLARLGRYGVAVGEAFQLRDDVLGVFGSPAATGKPSGGDLLERKATSLIVAAYQLADAPTRRLLVELMNLDELDDAALRRWKRLIAATGAVEMIEEMISRRVASALDDVDGMEINEAVCSALAEMAVACVQRRE